MICIYANNQLSCWHQDYKKSTSSFILEAITHFIEKKQFLQFFTSNDGLL